MRAPGFVGNVRHNKNTQRRIWGMAVKRNSRILKLVDASLVESYSLRRLSGCVNS